jgi:hypothetical protein
MQPRLIAGGAAALSLLLATSAAEAQVGQLQGNQANRQGVRLTPRQQQKKNFLPELRAVTEGLAKAAEVKIVVDPALFVPTAPKSPSTDLALDRALDLITSSIKGSSWRRVYLQTGATTTLPPADKLAASVRALEQLEHGGLVLENPATKKATTYLKNYSISQSFTEELQAGQFSPSPIYVVYATTASADAKSMEDRFADLQRQQMELMMQMSPEEMSAAMEHGMNQFMNMDPAVRQQMMGNMMQAGMRMFMNMPPDQRNQMFQNMGQMFQGFGGAPGGGGQPQRRP